FITVAMAVSHSVLAGVATRPATAQTGADFLSTGVVVRGDVTFERTKQEDTDTLVFFINIGSGGNGSSVAVRLIPTYALDKAYVSSNWYGSLVAGGTVTIRLADAATVTEETQLRSDSIANLVMCNPEPISRKPDAVNYFLRCLNFDEKRWA